MNFPAITNLVFDTMLLSRALRPDFHNHQLGNIVSQLGIEEIPVHRAVSDAVSTFAVFRKLLQPYSSNDKLTVEQALTLQGGTVHWPHFHQHEVDPGPETEIETAIRCAIERGENIVIEYQSLSSAHLTTREISPIYIARRPGKSYIWAYCLLRNENRVFRADRISRTILK